MVSRAIQVLCVEVNRAGQFPTKNPLSPPKLPNPRSKIQAQDRVAVRNLNVVTILMKPNIPSLW